MKNITTVSLCCLLITLAGCNRQSIDGPSDAPGSSPGGTVTTPAVRLPFFLGYFYGASGFGDYLDEIAPYTNWVHLEVYQLSQEDIEALAERTLRLKLAVTFSVVGPLNNCQAPDWQLQWERHLRPKVDAFRRRGILHSVYIADEPRWNHVSDTNVLAVARLLQSEGYPVMVIEEHLKTLPRPPVDYYGASCYYPVARMGICQEVYRRGGMDFVLAQAFRFNNYESQTENLRYGTQEEWAEIARDIRACGLVWWLAPDFPEGPGSLSQPEMVASQRRLAASFGIRH